MCVCVCVCVCVLVRLVFSADLERGVVTPENPFFLIEISSFYILVAVFVCSKMRQTSQSVRLSTLHSQTLLKSYTCSTMQTFEGLAEVDPGLKSRSNENNVSKNEFLLLKAGETVI